jgi:hypothetical protein
MASSKNCTGWPEGKKEQLGCGVTCDCPRVKDKLHSYDWVVEQAYLLEENRLRLSEIDAKSYSLINYFITEKIALKEERKQIAENVKAMLGG